MNSVIFLSQKKELITEEDDTDLGNLIKALCLEDSDEKIICFEAGI